MADQQQGQDGGTRQKITIGAIVIVGAILAWQVFGMFGGGSSTPAPQPAVNTAQMKAAMEIPKPAKIAKPEVMSEREAQLMRLQQETEAKYVAALNELQMLRIQKEIATTNKDISKAQLDSVKAQKSIVELLKPREQTMADVQGLLQQNRFAQTGQQPQQPQQAQQQAPAEPKAMKYSVISVSKAQSRWNAVLAGGGKLYNVQVGDVLPADGSKVARIDDGGVILEFDGKSQRVSLVPII